MRFVEPFALAEGISAEEKLEAERLTFLELTQGEHPSSRLTSTLISDHPIVCLWGNSTDLSLLINMTEDQIKALQSTGGEHLAATEKNILGNHLHKLWDTVKELRERPEIGGRIDFVLDNVSSHWRNSFALDSD